MAHTRAKRRAEQRQKEAAYNPDDGFWNGDQCSCEVRLFVWLVPRQGNAASSRLHWPFMISLKMCTENHLVFAHTADDATKGLAGQPTEHDIYTEIFGSKEPHLAHAG